MDLARLSLSLSHSLLTLMKAFCRHRDRHVYLSRARQQILFQVSLPDKWHQHDTRMQRLPAPSFGLLWIFLKVT
eukprot:10200387-Karenia_brevis.AAC.1